MEGEYSLLEMLHSYSASGKFSPQDHSNHKYMFVAKVLTGELGRYDDTQPSANTGKTHFSCGINDNDINNSTMFVIYSNTQAYPEYLITFI